MTAILRALAAARQSASTRCKCSHSYASIAAIPQRGTDDNYASIAAVPQRGTNDNSPPFQRRESEAEAAQSPQGTNEMASQPHGWADESVVIHHAYKRRRRDIK